MRDYGPQQSDHCTDNSGDRKAGEAAERAFCVLALKRGRSVTAHQIKHQGPAIAIAWIGGQYKRFVLPDITVWDDGSQHHEIKHKYATQNGEYGLEEYRFESLLWFAERTGRPVYYTIHDWKVAGATSKADPIEQSIEHWICCPTDVLARQRSESRFGPSWVNGEKKMVPILYWHRSLWTPLADLWADEGIPF